MNPRVRRQGPLPVPPRREDTRWTSAVATVCGITRTLAHAVDGDRRQHTPEAVTEEAYARLLTLLARMCRCQAGLLKLVSATAQDPQDELEETTRQAERLLDELHEVLPQQAGGRVAHIAALGTLLVHAEDLLHILTPPVGATTSEATAVVA